MEVQNLLLQGKRAEPTSSLNLNWLSSGFAPYFLIFIFKVQNCACAAFILLQKSLTYAAQAQFCTLKIKMRK